MKVAIFTPRLKSKGTDRIFEAFLKKGIQTQKIKLSSIKTNLSDSSNDVNYFNSVFGENGDLKNIDGALCRGIGINKTKKIYYRLGLYRSIELCDIRLINSRNSLENATNKMITSLLLKKNNIKTPDTFICESRKDALEIYKLLGGKVLIKPMFGSKGIGIIKIDDEDFAENIFYNLDKFDEPFYLQKFHEHNNEDIRAFVIGNQVIGSMKRISNKWKTNIAQGGKSQPIELSEELKELAIKSASTIGCEIAGVDIIKSNEDYHVIEVNAVPGFIGLQSVVKSDIAEEIAKYCINQFKK